MSKKPHERWLDKAYDDLEFGSVGLKTGHFSQVCFLAEQCIEKSLKGFIVSKGELYEKTHSLLKLTHAVPEFADILKGLEDDIKFVDAFYVPTRYPDGVPGSLPDGLPAESDARRALDIARKVFEIVKGKILLPQN